MNSFWDLAGLILVVRRPSAPSVGSFAPRKLTKPSPQSTWPDSTLLFTKVYPLRPNQLDLRRKFRKWWRKCSSIARTFTWQVFTSMHCIAVICIVIWRVTVIKPAFWQTWMDLWPWCQGSWVPWRPFFPQPQSLNWGVLPFTFWPPCYPFPQDTETQKSKTSFLLRLIALLRYEAAECTLWKGVLTKPFKICKLVISWHNVHFFRENWSSPTYRSGYLTCFSKPSRWRTRPRTSTTYSGASCFLF